MGATLLFPCCVPDALAYAQEASGRGEVLVAASSLAFDETARHFDTWFRLPTVYAPDFLEKLRDAVARHDIERVFAPVSSVHWMLERLRARGEMDLKLLGEMPIRKHARDHERLMAEADARHVEIAAISGGRSSLSRYEIAGVLRQSAAVFGESSATKVTAMMAIFADAPEGDVVEIGVLTGRSAGVLEMMARRHGTGAVLAIDPWSYASSVQEESPQELQEMVDVWDAKVPFETFLTQLLPLARPGCFNYLPMISREALAVWQAGLVHSIEFGSTQFAGRIAVLHVDGNHDHAAVTEDLALWLPHLLPGGWLVLDDYLWLHGDGPRRAGDALLHERSGEISRAFVCSGALFLRFGAENVS